MSIGDTNTGNARIRNAAQFHSFGFILRALGILVFALVIFTWLSKPTQVLAQSSVLLGEQTVETTADSNDAGSAEAFQITAAASSTLGSLTLYVDTPSSARQLVIGLYANSGGNPGALLAQGNSSGLTAGTWNTVAIPPVNVTAGTLYWIAILGTGGTLHFRDGGSTCTSQNSSQSNLTALPTTWTRGARWNTCRLSAYGSAASSSSSSGQSNPVLSVSQSALPFSATQGGNTNPAAAALNVTNTGGGTLNFTAASDSSWLAVSPASGTAPQSLQVAATLGSLTAGTYTGHITVAASGVQGSPATVTVTFNVAAASPILSVSSTTLSFSATQGSTTNPAASAVNVTNTGGGRLNFNANSDSTWLSVTPATGTAPQSLQVSATLGALSAGTYTGHVAVAASGVQGSPATVTVTFKVAAQSTETFKITGTISGSGGNGASVVLSGAANATVTASRSGNYTFSGQANGTYTVTPSKAGYAFSPTSQNVIVNGANATVPAFTAGAQTYSIAGTISGAGGNAATVALNGAAGASTTADGSGNYSFTGLANGSYSVAPSNPGYTFTPSSQAVAISGANAASINFTASAATATYTISGTITPAAVGSGATLTLSGTGTGSTTANSSGNFSFTSLNNGTYTITPSSSSATFSPTNQSVTVSGANVSGVSFTATSSVSQSACGNTLTSASPICQVIGAGHLNPAWTVISRHGEYAQSETECNVPGAITAPPLTITTSYAPSVCGDFNENGTVADTPSSWPYTTGDLQWSSASFLYGTVTVRAQMPALATATWPSHWFLDTRCQNQNIYNGSAGACADSNYTEIDMTECKTNSGGYNGSWCSTSIYHGTSPTGVCNWNQTPIDTNFHTYVMTWAPGSLSVKMDGASTGCTFSGASVPSGAVFMIIQNQTSLGIGPPNNANLPTTMVTDFVQVQNSSGTVIFQDNFAPDIYYAQAAAGTGSGDDCADARATSSMLAMDWVPGNTIHLCGALTTSITALGSGTSASPITVTFEPGAYFTGSVWSSAINLNGFTNIIVPTIPCGGSSCPN